MSNSSKVLAVSLLLSASSCTSDEAASVPAAPTNLTATPLGAGAHLTWMDNSMNENEFIVMRQQTGVDTAMRELTVSP